MRKIEEVKEVECVYYSLADLVLDSISGIHGTAIPFPARITPEDKMALPDIKFLRFIFKWELRKTEVFICQYV
jgi:hypothetical protein